MLAVVTSPYGLVTILLDEVTLSQKLRTPPLPVTHVLVGYQWQYIGLCPVKTDTIAIQATSCRTYLLTLASRLSIQILPDFRALGFQLAMFGE